MVRYYGMRSGEYRQEAKAFVLVVDNGETEEIYKATATLREATDLFDREHPRGKGVFLAHILAQGADGAVIATYRWSKRSNQWWKESR